MSNMLLPFLCSGFLGSFLGGGCLLGLGRRGSFGSHPGPTLRLTSAMAFLPAALSFRYDAKKGSEQESVELPNWRALGVAAAPATDAEPSARSVARGQTVDKAKYPLLPEAYRRFCCHARGRDPH